MTLVKCGRIFHLQSSWREFLYTKCQNINRNPSASPCKPPIKRLKLDDEKHPYPSVLTNMDDDVAHERNRKLLQEEMSKPKLRHEVLQNLMARTFGKRRRWILDGEKLRTASIVEEYPLLRKPLFVSICCFSVCLMFDVINFDIVQVTHEFNLIMHMDDSRDTFDNEWQVWEPAIIEYACAMQRKPEALQHALRDKDGERGMLAIFILYFTV